MGGQSSFGYSQWQLPLPHVEQFQAGCLNGALQLLKTVAIARNALCSASFRLSARKGPDTILPRNPFPFGSPVKTKFPSSATLKAQLEVTDEAIASERKKIEALSAQEQELHTKSRRLADEEPVKGGL